MSGLAQLQSARASRDAARREFDTLREQVQSDLDARGIGDRITDRATDTATNLFVEAIEIADNHRGIAGGTIIALALWFLRDPIVSAARKVLGLGNDQEEDTDDD